MCQPPSDPNARRAFTCTAQRREPIWSLTTMSQFGTPVGANAAIKPLRSNWHITKCSPAAPKIVDCEGISGFLAVALPHPIARRYHKLCRVQPMRKSNPIENTGVIRRLSDNSFLGSCFLFRYVNIILTADHVVRNVDPSDLSVEFPGSRAKGIKFQVLETISHPTADIAISKIESPDERGVTWTLYEIWNDQAYGLDVQSFGYPVDFDAAGSDPAPRFFKGYVQQYLRYASHLGYEYIAAELNFACPAGLSGASIVNTQATARLYGLITENREVAKYIDSFTEINSNGSSYKEYSKSIVNYGIFLWLPAYSGWVDSYVQPISQDEILRRSNNQHKWANEEGNGA